MGVNYRSVILLYYLFSKFLVLSLFAVTCFCLPDQCVAYILTTPLQVYAHFTSLISLNFNKKTCLQRRICQIFLEHFDFFVAISLTSWYAETLFKNLELLYMFFISFPFSWTWKVYFVSNPRISTFTFYVFHFSYSFQIQIVNKL